MSKFSKWFDFKHKYPVPVSCLNEQILPPFYNFQRESGNMYQSFYHCLPNLTVSYSNLNINPLVDIVEDENNFKVEVEMPGVDEKDIKVSISDNILTITAYKETSSKDEGKSYVIREIGYGSYERNIQLPENADLDQAESSFKKGMLWVTLPKKVINKSKARELEIKKS